MPWCESCSRFFTPTSMPVDGSCPSCGRRLADHPVQTKAPTVPWHFKVLVLAAAAYLGWRLLQMISWLL